MRAARRQAAVEEIVDGTVHDRPPEPVLALKTVGIDLFELVEFTPALSESPDEIKPLLRTFARWLEVQQRRVGGKIAESSHVKRHAGKSMVLYLHTAPAFRGQDYETRFRLADSI